MELNTGFPFERGAVQRRDWLYLRVQKGVSLQGTDCADIPYLDTARAYEAAGAACISVLTEPKWFLGRNQYLAEIAAAVSIPCIRKDFVVDEYMIYQAKVLGASAVLTDLCPAGQRDAGAVSGAL